MKIKLPNAIPLIYILVIAAVGCTKTIMTVKPEMPWHFSITDSNKNYTFDAQTYGAGWMPGYSFAEVYSGYSDTRYGLTTQGQLVSSNNSNVLVSINIGSYSDAVTAKKLLTTNTLSQRQSVLKEIFTPGKIFPLNNPSLQPLIGFTCYYKAENGKAYTQNFLKLPPASANDFVKIISSEIWNDNSTVPKIKVTLEFECYVQEEVSGIGFTGNPRKINGSISCFFQLNL